MRPRTGADTTPNTDTPDSNSTDPSNDASPAEDASVGPPLVWVAGGWNSCRPTDQNSSSGPLGMNIFKNFGPMMLSLKSKSFPTIEYVASCLRPNIKQAYYVHSSSPLSILSAPRDNLATMVAERARAQKSPLVIIGHSFGGWITMKGINVMSGNDIRLLLTMDPISPVTCEFVTAGNWLKQKISGDTTEPPPTGCTTSPTDITESQRDAIKAAVKRWVNIWQIDTLNALHADPIKQAENERIYLDAVTALNGHINLGLSPQVWQKIEAYIVGSL